MSDRIRKRTKYLTVCAMLSALGVLMLSLGAVIEVLDLSVAVLASIFVVYVVIEIGGGYPWMVWGVTATLSILLVNPKTPALFYAVCFGFYPIIKEKWEKRSRWLCRILKLITFHVCLGTVVLILWLFFPAQLDMSGVWWMPAALYALSLVVFIIYDFMLTRMISFYLFRLRNRFRIR